MDGVSLISIHVGQIAPLGPDGVPSAFVKQRREGPVAVGRLGLAGDNQADRSVHGGRDKAVYAYAVAHYAAWAADYPEHRHLFVGGGVGENLSIAGMTEADLCVGDIHRIGSATLQACEPRQPCFKLALRFGDKSMPKAMVGNGRAGWYYRVLEPGTIRPGDAVETIARPHPELGFARLIEIVNFRTPTRDELEAMATMDGLAEHLRDNACRSLLDLRQPPDRR